MSAQRDMGFFLNWISEKREEGKLDSEILNLIEKNVEGDRVNKEGLIADLLDNIERAGRNDKNKRNHD